MTGEERIDTRKHGISFNEEAYDSYAYCLQQYIRLVMRVDTVDGRSFDARLLDVFVNDKGYWTARLVVEDPDTDEPEEWTEEVEVDLYDARFYLY